MKAKMSFTFLIHSFLGNSDYYYSLNKKWSQINYCYTFLVMLCMIYFTRVLVFNVIMSRQTYWSQIHTLSLKHQRTLTFNIQQGFHLTLKTAFWLLNLTKVPILSLENLRWRVKFPIIIIQMFLQYLDDSWTLRVRSHFISSLLEPSESPDYKNTFCMIRSIWNIYINLQTAGSLKMILYLYIQSTYGVLCYSSYLWICLVAAWKYWCFAWSKDEHIKTWIFLNCEKPNTNSQKTITLFKNKNMYSKSTLLQHIQIIETWN